MRPSQSDLDEAIRWINSQESAISGPTLPTAVERLVAWLVTIKGSKPRKRKAKS